MSARPAIDHAPLPIEAEENLSHTLLAARLRRSWIAFVALEQATTLVFHVGTASEVLGAI